MVKHGIYKTPPPTHPPSLSHSIPYAFQLGPGFETYRYELRMLLERLNIKYLQSDRNPSPLRSLAAAMDQDRDDMPSDSDSLFEMTALRIRSEETVIRYESKKKDVGAEKSGKYESRASF